MKITRERLKTLITAIEEVVLVVTIVIVSAASVILGYIMWHERAAIQLPDFSLPNISINMPEVPPITIHIVGPSDNILVVLVAVGIFLNTVLLYVAHNVWTHEDDIYNELYSE